MSDRDGQAANEAGRRRRPTTLDRKTTLALTGLLALVVVLVAHERGSTERANRLYRASSPSSAADLYERHLENAAAELHYNFGTASLALGVSTRSQVALERGARSVDPETRVRSLYNLGLLNLSWALTASDADSAHAYATDAVRNNRDALRLRPGLEDAKWNLSMAHRMLDSLEAVARRRGGETSDTPVDPDALVRSESTADGDEDEVREEARLEGEAEAPADPADPAPLSPDEAARILAAAPADASLIVQKLLGLESRGRWGRQAGNARRPW